MNRLAAAGRASRAGGEVHRYDGLRDAQAWRAAGRTGMAGSGTHGYGGRRDAPAREIKNSPAAAGLFFAFRVPAPFPARV